MNANKPQWWQDAVIYQIYPKSFQDSGSKGTGDLQGIIRRLDYLKQLGVDALWLTPIYPSPQVDHGYDVQDYYDIDPCYGTMADFEELLSAAHARGLRVIMDIVVNHTSTQHPWFQSAIADRDSPYRDFYIWRDPVDGHEPNNWRSEFGGSAWQLDVATSQYYLHLFAIEQADLNWENPQVRDEVKKIFRFWAAKGVDGFRLDVINLISKDQDFPSGANGGGSEYYTDGPRVHEFLKEMHRDAFGPAGVMTVGEMASTSLANCVQYSAPGGDELSMVFNFHHMNVDYANGEKWTKAPVEFLTLKNVFNYWQQGMHGKGWNALFWCNHDQPRIVSRFGDEGALREISAKMLATALYGMQGTPYLYQGEEIGMTNPGYSTIDDYRDVESCNIFNALRSIGMPEGQILAILASKSRDNSRTPMQWSDEPNAGFTEGTPWIKVAANYTHLNVAAALADPASVFWYYRELIALRKAHAIFREGLYEDALPGHPRLWAYTRRWQGHKLMVLCNFYASEEIFQMPESWAEEGRITRLISNYADTPEAPASGYLRAYEAVMWLDSAT